MTLKISSADISVGITATEATWCVEAITDDTGYGNNRGCIDYKGTVEIKINQANAVATGVADGKVECTATGNCGS